MKPFFSYFGSKFRLCKTGAYPFPNQNATVMEVFGGSAGCSIANEPKKAVIYEPYEPVFKAWEYLKSTTPEEILSLPDRIYDLRYLELTAGQNALIGLNLGRADKRPRNRMSAWTEKTWPQANVWSPRKKEIIANQLHKIQHWEIHQASYEDIPVSKHGEDTYWFIDPPYVNVKKGNGYTFGADRINYKHLAEWVMELPGFVVVCEMDGADWLDFKPLQFESKSVMKRNYREVVFLRGG